MKTVWVFSILFSVSFLNLANAQSMEEQMTRRHPSCNDVFLNAVNILPKLYRQNAFDSMYSALQIWKRACGNSQEVQSVSLLLAMQQNSFTAALLDSTSIDLLNNYANYFVIYQRNTALLFKGQTEFYKLCSIWAKLLMEQKTLDDNERFICGVFTGSIIDPLNEIKTHPEKYPQLAELLKHKDAALRNGYRSNLAFLAGIWMPKMIFKFWVSMPLSDFNWVSGMHITSLILRYNFAFCKVPILILLIETMCCMRASIFLVVISVLITLTIW